MAYAGNIEFGLASVAFVLNDQVDCFSDLSNLIWRSVRVVQADWVWDRIRLEFMGMDKLVVDEFCHCTTVN